jgi:hypothetical protein
MEIDPTLQIGSGNERRMLGRRSASSHPVIVVPVDFRLTKDLFGALFVAGVLVTTACFD